MRLPLLCALCLLTIAASAKAVSIDSIDTFTTDNEGWRVGSNGVAPTFEDAESFDGQPGFLRHFSDGSGPNGRFQMWTQQSDWTGDYLAAGVEGVSLWADGRSGDDLLVWLGFDGPGGWHFTPAQTIATAADWERFEFEITPDTLIYADGSGGTENAADTLSDVTRFEIFAGPSGPVEFRSRGDLLRAAASTNVVWFDNIAAIGVPEPTSLATVGALIGVVAATRRGRG